MVAWYIYMIKRGKMTLEEVPPRWQDEVVTKLEEEG